MTTLRCFLTFLVQRFSFFLLRLHSDINKRFQLIFIGNNFNTVMWAKHGRIEILLEEGKTAAFNLLFLHSWASEKLRKMQKVTLGLFWKKVCILVAFSLFTRRKGNGRLKNVFKVFTLRVFVLCGFVIVLSFSCKWKVHPQRKVAVCGQKHFHVNVVSVFWFQF